MISPGFGHIQKLKQETQSTLSHHYTLCSLLCENTQNYSGKQQLFRDKFSALTQTQTKAQEHASH
jgi:hypothetical protein